MDKPFKVTTFKERFSELFDESEKTIIDLSKELHVSNQTISAWKIGTRSPKEPTVIAIANHFNVSVEWLLGFNVPKYNKPLDLQYFGKPPDEQDQPKTIEAKVLSKGIDKLPKEQREQALAMFKLMFEPQFADLFTKENEDDT